MSLYEACKPEIFKQQQRPEVAVIQYLRGVIDSYIERVDIDEVSQKIADLLDESVFVDNAEKFTVREHSADYHIVQKSKAWNLSTINFDKLREEFGVAQYKNIEITEIRAFIEHKLQQMMEQNHTRADFMQKLQDIIDRYNSGASSTDNYFDELVAFSQSVKEEDERHIREGLTEDELEIYDTLKKDNLTKDEEQKVKLAAKHLISRLVESNPKVLVQDWWKDGQTQRKVKSVVDSILNEDLPTSYDTRLFKEKCENVYDLILTFAVHGQKWVA